MKSKARLTSVSVVVAALFFLGCWFSASSTLANAQSSQGQNAVYPASGGCCVGSSSFVDASMFAGQFTSPNFCSVVGYVLNPSNHILLSGGGVVDARGLPGATGTNMTCPTTDPSPWAGITNPPPSVILLPAGTIKIPSTWILPQRVIGHTGFFEWDSGQGEPAPR